MSTRVVFLGTPAFAVPSLDALAALAARDDIDLVGVVTQPDRPGHRMKMTPPPVKVAAVELGLDVDQPERIPLGIGLVGQAAAEKQRILLNEVPPGYTLIHSSLGAAPASHALASSA